MGFDGIDDTKDDEFITADYEGLRDLDGWQRRDPWEGSSASVPKRVSMTIVPTHIKSIISSTYSSPYSSAIPATSGASVFSKSREAPPPADDGRLAETQSQYKSSLDMSEAELVELEDRARQAGCTGSSPFESRSPFAPTNISISYTTTLLPFYSPVLIFSSNVPVTGSKYFHSDCHEEDVDEIQRSPRGGITCRDTAEKIKTVFFPNESSLGCTSVIKRPLER